MAAYSSLYKWRFILVIIILSVIIFARYSGITDYIHVQHIWDHKDTLQLSIQEHYWLSVLSFIMLNMTVVVLAIPVTIALNVAAGYFFGVAPAILYCNIGSTGGALIAFFMVRYLLAKELYKRHHAPLERFNKKFHEHGASYLLCMQFIPVTPFGLITVLAGLSDIPAITFYWTTALGILPGSIIYAFAGQQMGTLHSVHDILSTPMIIALVALACLALVPVVINYIKKSSKKSSMDAR